jgi:DNA-binding FadR family transcriptional regulator
MEKPFRRPVLNELIRNYVKQYILDHNLSAGDPLPPETQLAHELGVGRSSVREAIKALQSLGIVEVRHGDGLYVREYNFDPILETLGFGIRFDTTTLSELAQIRFLLEGAAIEDAVKRIGLQDLDRLDNLMGVWKQRARDGEPHSDLDEEFHSILYGALNNETLVKLLRVFWLVFANLKDPVIQDIKPADQEWYDHQAILEAVKARDANLGRQRLMDHFDHLRKRIKRAIELSNVAQSK